ncbi:hypothetical protein HXX76_007892 [Chlamydomonas incerta]|uniref:Phospholipid/glycerol acyltransferase domain-containing protein n=1 Tax=Chlamydomonas incerta TaxID=51695 RepID=A0A835T9U0_CHLIN|nr:hypothetical protein HXX76_007892 [Chlamydomonas incerta]|eukprot:KAG2434165.1 hypothetical protein HXX76_007892 [Chlamydomonas incerta]
MEQSYSDTDDSKPSTSCRTGSLEEVSRALFHTAHLEDLSPALALYLPVGFALAAIRSALWIAGIALDKPWFRNQAVVDGYLKLLGVTVTWVHPERIPAGRHLLVSNHCTVGDLMMLFSHPSLPRRYTHLITSALPPRVTACKHLPVLLRPASPAMYDQLAAAAAGDEDVDASPVHLFPEGGMTNGRGMLRFSRGFTRIINMSGGGSSSSKGGSSSSLESGGGSGGSSCSSSMEDGGQQHHHQPVHEQQPHAASAHAAHANNHTNANAISSSSSSSSSSHAGAATSIKLPPGTGSSSTTTTNAATATTTNAAPTPMPVVPVALRARTLPGVNTHTLTSSFAANLFWMGFSPATELHATVLPPMSPAPGESRAAFVNRVQEAIAEELGVDVYDLTIQQKRQLAARRGGG